MIATDMSSSGDPAEKLRQALFSMILTTRPRPAFGRLSLGGSSGENSSLGYTSHSSLRAYGAQLGGDRYNVPLIQKRHVTDSLPGMSL